MKKAILCFTLFFIAIQLYSQNPAYTDSLRTARIAELNKMKPLFKSKKASEDSAFVSIYSDLFSITSVVSLITPRQILGQEIIYSKGQYPGNAENDFVNAKVGDVIGPYVYDNTVAIYKVKWKGMADDSVEVRHILIAYKGAERVSPEMKRSKQQAKILADSLLQVIQSGKTKMTDLVLPFTDDPGSKEGNLGDYGWFSRSSGFVQEFKDAGFNNPVGATVITETEFGYHIIQVLGKTGKHFCVKAISVVRLIDPDKDYINQAQQGVTLPAFPGGIIQLKKFLHDSLRYPADALAKHKETTVQIMFMIGKDARITDVILIESGDGHSVDDEYVIEAKRLIYSMPHWQPASYKGKTYDWELRFIIPFRLDE